MLVFLKIKYDFFPVNCGRDLTGKNDFGLCFPI